MNAIAPIESTATPENRPRRIDMREKLLDLAEEAALLKCFANISVDELAAAAGISKSGFLYHFKNKDELGLALVKRCTERKMELLEAMFERADALHDDPLHSYLVAIGLFSEMIENSDEFSRGYLVNTYTFRDRNHVRDVREVSFTHLQRARENIVARLEGIAREYPPREGVEVEALADMTLSIVEGGMIIATLFDDRGFLPRQMTIYRNLVSQCFRQDLSATSASPARTEWTTY